MRHEPARGERTGKPVCRCCSACAAQGPALRPCAYCGRACSCEGCTVETAELRRRDERAVTRDRRGRK